MTSGDNAKPNQDDWKGKIILPSVFEQETIRVLKQILNEIETLKLGMKSANQKLTMYYRDIQKLKDKLKDGEK